jgi:hypothetical protein
MKHKSLITLIVLIMSAIPAMAAKAPAVGVHLVQATSPTDTVYFRGPVTVQYQLTITNPTNAPITLTRMNLQSMGPGAYTLRTGNANVKTVIPANGSTTLQLSAWARARGGFLRSSEPVNIHGILWFRGPTGNFVKQFVDYVPQM